MTAERDRLAALLHVEMRMGWADSNYPVMPFPPEVSEQLADRLIAAGVHFGPNFGTVTASVSDIPEAVAAIKEAERRVGEAEAALRDAFEAMDAACKWAATQTGGIKTVEDADRHMKGYDALLDATVRVGKAAGTLR